MTLHCICIKPFAAIIWMAWGLFVIKMISETSLGWGHSALLSYIHSLVTGAIRGSEQYAAIIDHGKHIEIESYYLEPYLWVSCC